MINYAPRLARGVRGISPPASMADRLKFYDHSLPLYNATFSLASNIAGMWQYLRWYRADPRNPDERDELPPDHALPALWRDPNDDQSTWFFLFRLVQNLELCGWSPIEVQPADPPEITEAMAYGREAPPPALLGPPDSMWPIRPDRIKPTGRNGSWVYSIDDYVGRRFFLREQIMNFAYPHPSNDWFGHSPQDPAMESLLIHRHGQLFERKYFEEGATPNLLISLPDDFNAVQRQQMEEVWRETAQRHLPLFMGQDAKPTPLKETNREMELTQLQATAKLDASSAQNVPPIMQGTTELKYDNAEIQVWQFAWQAIHPRLSLIESVMNLDLCPRFTGEGERIVCEFDRAKMPKIEESETERKQADLDAVKVGALGLDEYRKRWNLPPRSEVNDTFVMASQLVEVGLSREVQVQQRLFRETKGVRDPGRNGQAQNGAGRSRVPSVRG